MKNRIGSALALLLAPLSAHAATLGFIGDTRGGPVFHRPNDNGVSAPTTLAGGGLRYRYAVTLFSSDENGLFSITNFSDYDNYLGIYAKSFDPGMPLLDVIAFNDNGIGTNAKLTDFFVYAGITYYAVTSGFSTDDAGAFLLVIEGPGRLEGSGPFPLIGSVPEPANWAMIIAGLGMAGWSMRRRRHLVSSRCPLLPKIRV
jgi:hypothetical protein